MTLRCDWCDKPIYGTDKWGYEVVFRPFHSLGLGVGVPSKGPGQIVIEAHVHPKPCKDELGWAIGQLLEDREPLETDGPTEDVEESPREDREDEAQRRRDERVVQELAWRRMPRVEKERAVLNALGNDRLTVGELTERMQAELTEYRFHEPAVRGLVGRLLAAREVERKGEPRVPGGKAIRYRYFRRRNLEGPIADLERTFHD